MLYLEMGVCFLYIFYKLSMLLYTLRERVQQSVGTIFNNCVLIFKAALHSFTNIVVQRSLVEYS